VELIRLTDDPGEAVRIIVEADKNRTEPALREEASRRGTVGDAQ
jgi:hypothetical protein